LLGSKIVVNAYSKVEPLFRTLFTPALQYPYTFDALFYGKIYKSAKKIIIKLF
jgi:hypothetical protein